MVAFVIGGVVRSQAKSALHEIEAFILFLIGTIFVVGSGTVRAVDALRQEIAYLFSGEEDDTKASVLDTAKDQPTQTDRTTERQEPRLS